VYSFLPVKHRHRAKLVLTLHDYGLACPKKSMMYNGKPCEDRSISKCVPCASSHYGTLKGTVTALTATAARRSALNKVDRFIAVSDAVAERCALRGTCEVETIPNFISDSVPAAQPNASERKLAEQLPQGNFILFVGDLMTLKGLPTLLDAYSRLADPWPLVLIGRRCVDTPTQIPTGVSIFESWPHGAVLEAWRRCTFGILPSTGMEACATVVMEANAMAKPMIVSRTGGLPEIVDDGVSGLLIPPGNAELLAAAMQTLMENDVLRLSMAEASQRKSRTLMADAVVPRIESIYLELMMQQTGRLTDRDDAPTRIPANV
jgi:glycosyltransferase involved in cell wall biosynthesis